MDWGFGAKDSPSSPACSLGLLQKRKLRHRVGEHWVDSLSPCHRAVWCGPKCTSNIQNLAIYSGMNSICLVWIETLPFGVWGSSLELFCNLLCSMNCFILFHVPFYTLSMILLYSEIPLFPHGKNHMLCSEQHPSAWHKVGHNTCVCWVYWLHKMCDGGSSEKVLGNRGENEGQRTKSSHHFFWEQHPRKTFSQDEWEAGEHIG